MLQLEIEQKEIFDEQTCTFVTIKPITISLEHSLISIKKWESRWHKSFLSSKDKTAEQMLDYIKCMTVTQNVPDDVYKYLSEKSILKINAYIEDTMTATFFGPEPKSSKRNNEIITAELIYYWMISYNIPVEFQKWHINQLLTLIRVCSVKNEESDPNKKKKRVSKSELAAQRAKLNAERRAKLQSKG